MSFVSCSSPHGCKSVGRFWDHVRRCFLCKILQEPTSALGPKRKTTDACPSWIHRVLTLFVENQDWTRYMNLKLLSDVDRCIPEGIDVAVLLFSVKPISSRTAPTRLLIEAVFIDNVTDGSTKKRQQELGLNAPRTGWVIASELRGLAWQYSLPKSLMFVAALQTNTEAKLLDSHYSLH